MLPQYGEFMGLSQAFAVVIGVFAWWHASDPKGDELFDQATDELIEGISNADHVGKIEDETWNNLRDQTTVEQVEKWREEQEFRKGRNRN